MHRFIKKIHLLLFSCLITACFFLSLEFACRALHLTELFNADFVFYIHNTDNDVTLPYNREDALLMWSPHPHYSDALVSINSQGFNDKEYSISKPDNTLRILCLGDSSTFWGSYHSQLENTLNTKHGQENKRFEVINAGVTGYTSCQGLFSYTYKGMYYNPDIVTFYFGINDPIERFYLSDKEILQPDIPLITKRIKNRLLLNTHVYKIMRKCMQGMRKNEYSKTKQNVPRVSLSDFKHNIIELNNQCKKNNAYFILINPPLCKERSLEWDRAPRVMQYRKVLEDTAKQYNIPLITIPSLTEYSTVSTIDYFNKNDPIHPSQEGHALIMQALYDYLVTHNLLNTSPKK